MELHTISIDLGKTVFHPITRLPGLRHFADRLLGSWTVNFRLSITAARTLPANWFAGGWLASQGAASQRRYSLLIGFFAV